MQIEVEGVDKMGSFIGYLFIQSEKGASQNLSELLVENGLASVHFTADRSQYYNSLLAAEKRAKEAKLGIWKHFVEEVQNPVEENITNGSDERVINYRKVVVTEIQPGLHFSTQSFDDGRNLT